VLVRVGLDSGRCDRSAGCGVAVQGRIIAILEQSLEGQSKVSGIVYAGVHAHAACRIVDVSGISGE